jgi:hypothetical protein
VKVDFGIRHILFIYPLLAVSAAGAYNFWERNRYRTKLFSALLIGLLGWQIVSSVAAYPDYIAYFNEIGRAHPDHLLLFGCDLDCGQDVERLRQALRSREISHLSLRLWTSADLTRMGLPPFETLSPYHRATGWIAVSILFLRSGETIWGTPNPDAYSWLESYQPSAYIGKTIRLYYIPEPAGATSHASSPERGPSALRASPKHTVLTPQAIPSVRQGQPYPVSARQDCAPVIVCEIISHLRPGGSSCSAATFNS